MQRRKDKTAIMESRVDDFQVPKVSMTTAMTKTGLRTKLSNSTTKSSKPKKLSTFHTNSNSSEVHKQCTYELMRHHQPDSLACHDEYSFVLNVERSDSKQTDVSVLDLICEDENKIDGDAVLEKNSFPVSQDSYLSQTVKR